MAEVDHTVLGILLVLVLATVAIVRIYSVVISMWLLAIFSFTGGLGLGTLLLSNFKVIPNLALLLQLSGTLKKVKFVSIERPQYKKKGCTICMKKGCNRHRVETSKTLINPWESLQLPKPVDEAVSEFLEIMLRTHLYSWYWDVSHDQGFVDETRYILRYALSIILERSKKVDLPKFILRKLLKKFMIHLDCFIRAKERATQGSDIQQLMFDKMKTYKHFAVQNEVAEKEYLRYLIRVLLPYLLPPNARECRSASYFLEELLNGIVLNPLAEKLSEPDIVNNLLLIWLDEETIPEPDYPPHEKVKFLVEFGRKRVVHIKSALNVSSYDLIHQHEYLYPFMQFMKREGSLNLLQFCLAVEEFNKRSLASELTEDEQNVILDEAEEINALYFQQDAVDQIDFPKDIVKDFQDAIASPNDSLTRLRTAAPLFRAYEYAVDVLEKVYAPLFHHSDEFYALICGDRNPKKGRAVESNMVKRKFMPLMELSKLASKIKAKKQLGRGFNQTIGNSEVFESKCGFRFQVSKDSYEAYGESEDDLLDDEHDRGDSDDEIFDLSYWHITIPHLDYILEKNKRTFVFILNVERIGEKHTQHEETSWQVVRKYNEFYVLDRKLRRFHEKLNNAELPPKRTILKKDFEYLSSIRLKLQEYLQRLARSPVLRGSSLLHSFLTPGSEITGMFEPESVSRGAERKVKSLKSKLIIEKGQNLELFLNSFISSAEPPLKKKAPMKSPPMYMFSGHRRRDSKMYLPPPAWAQRIHRRQLSSESEDLFTLQPTTVTEYILYAGRNFLKVSTYIHHFLTCVRYLLMRTIDDFVERYVRYKLSLATADMQLVSYIHLLRDLVFFDNDPPRTDTDKVERRDQTLYEMLRFMPEKMVQLIGQENHEYAIRTIFEMFQHPRLNKQLVYVLLDELIFELFPELVKEESTKS